MNNFKNLSKRGLALLLCLVMCLGMLDLSVFAADRTAKEYDVELAIGDSKHFGAESAVSGLTGTWTSSDESVLSIDENGTATAISAGTAAVTFIETLKPTLDEPLVLPDAEVKNPEENEPVVTPDPLPEENEPTETPDPLPEENEPTEAPDPLPEENEPTETPDPLPEENEPTEAPDPLPEENEPTEAPDPLPEKNEPTDAPDPLPEENEPTEAPDPPPEASDPLAPEGQPTSPEDTDGNLITLENGEVKEPVVKTWTVLVYDPDVRAFVEAADKFIAELEKTTFTSEEEMASYMESFNLEIQEMINSLSEDQQASPEFVDAYLRLTESMGLKAEELVNANDWNTVKQKLESGVDVTLTANIEGNSTITISKDVTLNLNGKTITYKGQTGSVFHVTGGTFTLNGPGTITGGKGTLIKRTSAAIKNAQGVVTIPAKWQVGSETNVVDSDSLNGYAAIIGGSRTDVTCGGAILLTGYGKLVMNGGTIGDADQNKGNKAAMGAGICAFRGTEVTINGGSIIGNVASTYAGGGMFLGGKNNVINPTNGNIIIDNNRSNTVKDLGGGGIFVDSAGSLKVVNAVIHDNTADGLGGGVAGCLHGMVSNLSPDTAAIYSNKTTGNYKTLNNIVDHDGYIGSDGNSYKVFNSWNDNLPPASVDYFVAGYSVIGSRSLGGGKAQWEGFAMARPANYGGATPDINGSIKDRDPIVLQGLLGLTVKNPTDVADAVGNNTASKVYITNNYSGMHGGGIGTNGMLTFGETNFAYSETKITLNAKKSVEDSKNDKPNLSGYNFRLLQGSTVLATATSDANGVITFPELLSSDLFGSGTTAQNGLKVTLTLKEIAGNQAGMKYDTTEREIVLTANRTVNKLPTVTSHGGENKQEVYKITDNIVGVTVDGESIDPSNNIDLSKAPNGTFRNKMEYGKLTVSKQLSNPEYANDDPFTFTVTIGGTSQTITLKAGESWTSDAYPVGTRYSVTEINKSTGGYTYESGEINNGTIVEGNNNSVTITNRRNVANLTVKKTVTVNIPSSENFDHDKTFEIVVKLGEGDKTVADGTTTYVENGIYTFHLKHNATATITGIPTGTLYTVTETKDNMDSGYSYVSGNVTVAKTLPANGETETIVNHYYKAKFISKSVTKDWNGGDNYRPMSITVQLLQNGQNFGEAVKLSEDNNWTAEWNSLPEYAGDGKPAYTYTVKEVAVSYPALDEGETGLKADPRDGNIIRVRNTANKGEDGNYEIVGGWIVSEGGSLGNTWRGKTELGDTSFTVHKIDSETEEPIDGVTFTLTKNGAQVDEQTTKNGGFAQFSGLTDGTYILEETGVPEGYRVDGTKEEPVNLHRTWQIDIVKDGLAKVETIDDGTHLGQNTWNWKPSHTDIALDGENHTGTLTIGNQIIKGNISVSKTLDLDSVNPGENILPEGQNFTFGVYSGQLTADEIAAKRSSDAEADKPLDTLTVTAYGGPDTSIDLRYGWYTIVETARNTPADYDYQSVSFAISNVTDPENVKVIESDGKAVGYQVFVNEQGKTFAVTATNHYTRHLGDLSVSKTVTGNRGETDRGWSFQVKLTAPAPYVKLDGREYTYLLSSPVANEDGTTTNVSVPVEGVELLMPYDLALAEAKAAWDAEQSNLPEGQEPAAFDEDAWKSANEENSFNYEGGKEVRVIAFTLKHGETFRIENLPVGTTYVVTENEADTEGYSTTSENAGGNIVDGVQDVSFNNYRNYNAPNTVNITVNKVWAGDGDIERPASVTVQLYRNGSAYGDSVTLSSANSWRYTWNSLDRSSTWTVEEVNTPAGYTSTVTRNGNTFIITNTYEEEIPEPDVPLEEIPDDDVPLASLPFEEEIEIEIPDEDVPLAEVPETGDSSTKWFGAALLSSIGLIILSLLGRKKRSES